MQSAERGFSVWPNKSSFVKGKLFVHTFAVLVAILDVIQCIQRISIMCFFTLEYCVMLTEVHKFPYLLLCLHCIRLKVADTDKV